jgi:DNA end-binding protein Ku
MAKQLVDSLAGDFEPQKYRDSYRQEVLDQIERKAQGEEISVQVPAEEVAEPAPDLMSALKASLEAVRARDGEAGAAAGGNGKPAAKRAGAKKAAAKKPTASKAPAKKPGTARTPAKR